MTSYYGFPERHKRGASWTLLCALAIGSSLPWVCIGDFSDLLSPSNKKGGVAHPDWLFRGFHGALTDCSLNELFLHVMVLLGSGVGGSPHWVQEKLDRCFATADWLEVFPSHKLSNLFAATSDHSPILLQFSPPSRGNVSHQFRFENLWLREDEFVSSFEMWWGSSVDLSLVPLLSHCVGFMANWRRNFLQKFRNKLKNCNVRVEQLRSSTDKNRVIEFF